MLEIRAEQDQLLQFQRIATGLTYGKKQKQKTFKESRALLFNMSMTDG